jgi:tRNA uridine 5-carboxymethylaminomethyl modification enzyme
VKFSSLLKRAGVGYRDISMFDPEPILDDDVIGQVEIEVKYSGYIDRLKAEVKRLEEIEEDLIPSTMDYDAVSNLSTEAREKLKKTKPASVGQAMRIPGLTPSDIMNLSFHLKHEGEK